MRLLSFAVVASLAVGSSLHAQPAVAPSSRSYWNAGSGPITSADSAAALANMKSALRDFVTEMEAYFSDSGTYTTNPRALRMKGAAPGGVTLRVLVGNKSGWSGSATHRAFPGKSCVIAVNGENALPSLPMTLNEKISPRDDGSPVCDRLDAPLASRRSLKVSANRLTVSIANEDALDIGAGKFAHFKFEHPVNDLNCKVQGRVKGLAGGKKDVAVYLFTDDQFIEFMMSPTDSESNRAADVPLDYQLYGSGTYYLVVSNTFSIVTAKVAQVKADVRCTRTPRPHIGM